jgi:hypothetical protein
MIGVTLLNIKVPVHVINADERREMMHFHSFLISVLDRNNHSVLSVGLKLIQNFVKLNL